MARLAHDFLKYDAGLEIAGFTIDRPFITGTTLEGLPIVPFDALPERFPPDGYDFLVAVGYSRINGLRRDRFEEGVALGYRIPRHVSSAAHVWPGLSLRPGCLIYEGALVQTGATLGAGVVVRAGANVGHHSTVGDHSFLASRAVTGGNVHLGSRVFVGLGAVIADHVQIADRCLIGAGAVVLQDTEPDGVYVGIPARRLAGKSSLESTSGSKPALGTPAGPSSNPTSSA
jgi:sugar O-acyltransferase (sialic acid O-acetyltransferase NeuD family)